MPERLYRLTEAAQLLGISVDTLKLYEAKGRMTYRREFGMRVLTADDVAHIRAQRAAGIPKKGRPKKPPAV